MEKQIQEQLSEIKKLVTAQVLQQKSVLTLSEAANYASLKTSYLYQLVSKGLIPCYKPNGKKLYFSRQELDQWLLSKKQSSKTEVETAVDDLFANGWRAVS